MASWRSVINNSLRVTAVSRRSTHHSESLSRGFNRGLYWGAEKERERLVVLSLLTAATAAAAPTIGKNGLVPGSNSSRCRETKPI